MHPLIHRPEYDHTVLEEVIPRLWQTVKIPVDQVCLDCFGAVLQQLTGQPVCFLKGTICECDDIRTAIEDGFFDDYPRVDDPRQNAEAYINYLMDLVNVGVDEIFVEAETCRPSCVICQAAALVTGLESLLEVGRGEDGQDD